MPTQVHIILISARTSSQLHLVRLPQFTSPVWKGTLTNLQISLKFSPNGNLQNNPTERIYREIYKHSHEQYTVWAELIPFIERWLNITMGSLTGYSPVEMMIRELKTDIFEDNFSKYWDQTPQDETLEDKLFRAYVKMIRKV